MIDNDTLSVVTTFTFDFVLGLCILLGWLIFRKCRGDSKHSSDQMIINRNEYLTSEGIDEATLDKILESEAENDSKNKLSAEWRESFKEIESYIVVEKEEKDDIVLIDDQKEDEDNGKRHSKNNSLNQDESDIDRGSIKRRRLEMEKDTILSFDAEEQEEKSVKKAKLKSKILRKFTFIKRALRADKLKPRGFVDWFRILRGINDQELKETCGVDIALYLIFIRMSTIFFLVITILNIIAFLPIFLTGDPKYAADILDSDGNISLMAEMTILNITGTNFKMITVYVFMNVFYTMMVYALIFNYWRKSMSWKYQKHSHLKEFNEHDIAKHTVLVSNLPQNISVIEMSKRLKHVFEKIYPDDQVVIAKAQPRMDRICKKVKEIIKTKKALKYCERQLTALKGQPEEQKQSKRLCCRKKENDYKQQKMKLELDIQKQCKAILEEQYKEQKRNSGIGIVTFMSNVQVQQTMMKDEFDKKIMKMISKDDRGQIMPLQWEIINAPIYSDVIWDNIYYDDGLLWMKSWVLLIILFFICICVVTPISLIDNLEPIITYISKKFGENSIFSIALQTYSSTLILLAFNSGILPLLIDIIAYLEQHKTLSNKMLSKMRKQFFFQIMTTIFLQLTLQSSIYSLIDDTINTSSWSEIFQKLGKNLVSNNYFFLRYLIQLAFISNGILLLDIPHFLIKTFKKFIHNRAQKKEAHPKPFIDDKEYDISYQQAHALVCFSLGLIFCGTMPLISLFAFLFFAIRYYIDKYNLMFVYNKSYEGYGVIKGQVLTYIMVSLYCFQILNLGYFTTQDAHYFIGGGIFILVQTFFIFVVKYYYNHKKQTASRNIVKMEEASKCDNLEDYENSLSQHDGKTSSLMSRTNTKLFTRFHQFIDSTDMNAPGRRITLENEQFMSEHNLKKLQDAYKHPFEKIPLHYYKKVDRRKSSINDNNNN